MNKLNKKHTNIYPYVYIHIPRDTQTYINTDAHMHKCILFIIYSKWLKDHMDLRMGASHCKSALYLVW